MAVSSLYGGLRPLLRGRSSYFGPSRRAESVEHAPENRNCTHGLVVDPSPDLILNRVTPRRTRFSWPPSRPCGKLARPSPIPATRNLAPTEFGGSHDLPLPPDRENGDRSIHHGTSTEAAEAWPLLALDRRRTGRRQTLRSHDRVLAEHRTAPHLDRRRSTAPHPVKKRQ